jgi:Aldehyde dehydrogenase family
MANDSAYGLAAYVWSQDINDAITTAHRLEAGWVQVDQGGGQVVGQSDGGYKQSGPGREVSLEGMIAGFTQTKQINVRLGHGATPPQYGSLTMPAPSLTVRDGLYGLRRAPRRKVASRAQATAR